MIEVFVTIFRCLCVKLFALTIYKAKLSAREGRKATDLTQTAGLHLVYFT